MPHTQTLKATTLKAPFAWVGGKSRLAASIVQLMPPHKRYIEVFGSGLSVLYAKPREGARYVEVINDSNSDLINLHTIIKTAPQSLALYLHNMLYSREIFEHIKSGKLKARNKIEKAALYYCLLSLSFGSKGDNFAMCKVCPPKKYL